MGKIRALLDKQTVFISWIISFVATLGSLYFSEVMRMTPCAMCWYQRIMMYPLAVILAIATIKNDQRIAVYVWPVALIGASISTYHYLLQKTDWLAEPGQACGIIPCTTIHINWFGLITIPFLALIAFLLIFALHFRLWLRSRKA